MTDEGSPGCICESWAKGTACISQWMSILLAILGAAFRLLIFSITIVALIVMLIIETFYGFVEVTLQNAYFTLMVDLEFMFCLVYADGLAHLPSFGIAVETGKQTAGGCAGSQLSWWPSGKVTSNSDCSVKRMRVPSGSMRQSVAPL